MYTCPMHPQIVSDKKGTCPLCGMNLIRKDNVKTTYHDRNQTSYTPLVVILGLILLTTITLSFRDAVVGVMSFSQTISYFMIAFFITFSGFKLLDLNGFAQAYSTYDLLASRWHTYGYIYPFIELFFGLAMILFPVSNALLWSEIFVMTFSGIGVVKKLARRESFQCACLGTVFKIPLTSVTLIEDFGMAFLALVMLVL